MKTFTSLFTLLLIAGLIGCSGDTLTGALSDHETLETSAAKHSTAGDAMVGFVTDLNYTADLSDGLLPCLGGVMLPARAAVSGRAYHLGETTGWFTTTACALGADGILTSEGEWQFIGEGGHRLMGTWTGETSPEGKLTGHSVVTGGIGMFGGASGWSRFKGRVDLEAGTGTFTGYGRVSAPKDVVAMSFVDEQFDGEGISHGTACVNRNGETVFVGDRQASFSGLSTFGAYESVVSNERCTSYQQGILTFYGTWTYTYADGDVLYGTHSVVIGVSEPWPAELLITGGEGRFEGVTGWMNGEVKPNLLAGAEFEGILFMPR